MHKGRKTRTRAIFCTTCLLACAWLCRAPAGQYLYSATDLGTLGGSASSASALNDLGQIVGSADIHSATPVTNHAFLFTNGALADLGTLGDYLGGSYPVSKSAATALNNRAQVVGYSYTSSGPIHAFLWDQGVMTDLGTLPGSQQSKASAINDQGQLVGWTVPSGIQHAFLYDIASMTMTDLGTLGAGTESYALAINNHGVIVGDSWTNNSGLSDLAFVYSNGVMAALGKLGALPAINAYAINDNGQIVGYAGGVDTGGPTTKRGFIYSDGVMTDLGDLGSYWTNVLPFALNNKAQIVGTISGYQTIGHAFLYSNGTLTDLNNLIDPASGWTLLRANGINDNGQIVCTAENALAQTHAVLLTPRPLLQNLHASAAQVQFTLTGMTGVVYSVQYAPSLPPTNWALLTNVVLSSAPAPLVDTASSTTGQRYYRAIQR